MEFKYLSKWVEENSEQNLVFDEILKFEDQYKIQFRNRKKYLHINLSSQNCFCFFTENKLIPFSSISGLDTINDHLHMAKMSEIKIFTDDRIIRMMFSKMDIYNKKLSYELVLELIPRFQNIILIKDKIIDSIKKISFAENHQRQILPSLEYVSPDTNFKVREEEIKYPIYIKDNHKFEENSGKTETYANIDQLFEKLYYDYIFYERNERIKRDKVRTINRIIKKKNKKIEKLKVEFKDSMKEEKWLHFAELLKANYGQIIKGMKDIELKNYYEVDFPIVKIPLIKEKNAKDNIEYYFKKNRKSKDGKKKIAQQIIIARNEIEQLEKDVFEFEEKEVFLYQKQEQKKKKKQTSEFKKITIDSNWEIYIGRTGKENDELTTRLAKHYDWWFHTRIFRGTHILLRNLNKNELPAKLKHLCCRLAAYYSKAKTSTNVPVDFTLIKYVRKPRKSAPGFVTYENQKTLYVDPLSMREAVKILNNSSRIITDQHG